MTEPLLEDYPGYFPEGSRPFWTRPKVAVVGTVVGLLIGVAGSGDPEPEAEPAPKVDTTLADVRADLVEALEENGELEARLADEEEAGRAAVDAALRVARKDQRRAVRAAVARVRREERSRTASAVAAAKAAVAPAPAPAAPQPLAASGGTDPRFSWCYEANDAGFGPYRRGVDPEYDWYDDRDGDGLVCES